MNDKTTKPKRQIVPPGYQVRKKLGWDEEEQIYRLQIEITREEYERLKDKAIDALHYPQEHLKWKIRKWLG